jgi:hypothetical protein
LDQLLDRAVQAPLSEPDCHKIKTTLHTLVEMLAAKRSTEKTGAVVGTGGSEAAATEPAGPRRRRPTGMGATRRRLTPEPRRCPCRIPVCAAWRGVPGVPQGEGVRAKGAPAAGAHCGTSAVGRHRV